MIERLKTQVRIGYAELDEIKFKINELVNLANKLPVMIQGHRWQEDKPAEQTEEDRLREVADGWLKNYEIQKGIIIAQKMKLATYREALEKIKSNPPPRFSMEENSEIEATYQKICELQAIAKTSLEGGE